MTDLEKLIEDRVDVLGRGWMEFCAGSMDEGSLLDVISFTKDGMTLVVIPTVADDAMMLEILSFVDGIAVGVDGGVRVTARRGT